MGRTLLSAACALLCSSIAMAQIPAPPVQNGNTGTPAPVTLSPPQECCLLPALIPVRIEITTHLNSATSKIGDRFPIRLAAPLDLGELEIPAGIEGIGEVIHAAKSGFGGKGGELILAARYLDYHGTHIPLRSLSYAPENGKGREGTALGLAIAGGLAGGVAAMFIKGGEVDIPPGTLVYAKTAAAVKVTS